MTYLGLRHGDIHIECHAQATDAKEQKKIKVDCREKCRHKLADNCKIEEEGCQQNHYYSTFATEIKQRREMVNNERSSLAKVIGQWWIAGKTLSGGVLTNVPGEIGAGGNGHTFGAQRGGKQLRRQQPANRTPTGVVEKITRRGEQDERESGESMGEMKR